VRAHDEEILRRKVVDANDSADIGAIAQTVRPTSWWSYQASSSAEGLSS
jgi:hypothetical protein